MSIVDSGEMRQVQSRNRSLLAFREPLVGEGVYRAIQGLGFNYDVNMAESSRKRRIRLLYPQRCLNLSTARIEASNPRQIVLGL